MVQRNSLKLGCQCGSVQVELAPEGVAAATRLRCYCTDCQTEARHLGYALPTHQGTDLIHTTPDRVTLLSGQENLAALRLSPKGIFRWYASCCDTPMFNSLPKPGKSFLGLVVHAAETQAADDSVGPVWGHAFTKSAPPGLGAPGKDVNFGGIGLGVIRRMLGGYLTGRRKINPLVNDAGEWNVTPTILTREQRRAAASSGR
ncbi:DUF6151 family protein [Thalassovita sp.]|uniref:DUF6151 family protein n=1 Tax=Thalassovita sp. TaxID=1979401 RepID=UPI0028816E43|nr:DUF6151 family protein [Thalassovita sp.]MDF1801907.1 DUF6151 family protein [Thalassovita sp.]